MHNTNNNSNYNSNNNNSSSYNNDKIVVVDYLAVFLLLVFGIFDFWLIIV